MGSKSLIIFLIVILFVGSNVMVNAVDTPDIGFSFQNKEEFMKWANSFFFGGYKIDEFKKDDTNIIVIIGSFTSGLNTSYLRIYLNKEDKIELLIIRESVQGKLEVVNKEDSLFIVNNENTILIIPWDGLYSIFK